MTSELYKILMPAAFLSEIKPVRTRIIISPIMPLANTRINNMLLTKVMTDT